MIVVHDVHVQENLVFRRLAQLLVRYVIAKVDKDFLRDSVWEV